MVYIRRCAVSSGGSDHRVQGECTLDGAGMETAARRGRFSGTGLRRRDDGERNGRPVGQGRLRVEPRDQVHGGRAGRRRQLLLPRVRREPGRSQPTAAVRLRHSHTAAGYVELYVQFTSPNVFPPFVCVTPTQPLSTSNSTFSPLYPKFCHHLSASLPPNRSVRRTLRSNQIKFIC